jgi:hypothetical protein
MRTKTLLLAAAFSAVGAATAMAQVYSVNAVGYVNKALKPGFNLIANPLDAGDNTVAKLFAGLSGEAILYTYAPGTGFKANAYGEDDGVWKWSDPGQVLAPGQGFFLRVLSAQTVTFVGEVKQGNLSTPLAAGYNLVASQVPQAGKIQTDLGLDPANDDQVLTFNVDTQRYDVYTYDGGDWLVSGSDTPVEPTIAVGEGVWVRKKTAGSWTRNFSVNP